MSGRPRQHWLDLVTGYFDAVMREDFEDVLGRFTGRAVITIIHGDNPIQVFEKACGPETRPFEEFYGHLRDNYVVRFEDLHCVIDAEGDTAAAIFAPKLTPKPGSAYVAQGSLSLRNCNFFWFASGKIDRMTIYYAQPGSAVEPATRPTPFPRIGSGPEPT